MKAAAILGAFLLLCVSAPAQTLPASDMPILLRQATQWELSPDNSGDPSSSPSEQQINRLLAWAGRLQPDGSWTDINYKDQSRDFWKAGAHLDRALAMAKAAAGPAPQPAKSALRDATLRAAHYWIIHDFRNPNWWQNQIGVPQKMVRILLLLGDSMNPADRAAALKIVDRATLTLTGQNRVWMAGITFRKALVEDDPALARQARDIILAELRVTSQEGLQADWSFHQHGPQQQMGNYGLSFATDMAAWSQLWRGTALAIPEGKLALLRNFLVKGEAAVRANNTMDISACGRQLFPGSPLQKSDSIRNVLTAMAHTDPAHAQAYLAAEAMGSQPAGAGNTANVSFFRSDFMVHRRPAFYASVKLSSNRVIGGELVNGENLRGRYLADGATFLYQTGREYSAIFPVWDWRRIPGVTCVTTGTTLAPAGKMPTDFAGGASDGVYGVEALDLHRDGVTARKAWFFLDQAVVCLGAGITGTGVRTSIEQRLADNAPSSSAGPLSPGVHPCKGISWLLSGSEGYLFPHPTDLSAGTQTQTGSWKNVYSAGSPAPLTQSIFSIWIDHPAAGGSYACILLPGVTTAQLQAAAASPPVQILSNTPAIQAIADPSSGLTAAIFHTPGALTTPALSLTASAPCAVIIRAGRISVADPTQKQASLTLTINGKPHSIPLPRGQSAGSTVTMSD
jgi:chondroitin AC lyase